MLLLPTILLKILELDDFLYIDNFRTLYSEKSPKTGNTRSLLVRKGNVGEWKKYMTNQETNVIMKPYLVNREMSDFSFNPEI